MAPFRERAVDVSERDFERVEEDACARVERAGLLRRGPFPLDVVPRVLPAAEWERLEAALAQRVTALNAFVADAYGPRRIVQAGVVPARVIETAEHYEPGMRGVEPPGGLWVGIAGLDLVREPSGEFVVLEDNLMTPSGFAYAAAARDAVAPSLELVGRPRDYSELPELLAGALGEGYVRRAQRGARERRLLGAPVGGRAARDPARAAERAPSQGRPPRPRRAARRRRLPPHRRRPAAHRGRRAARARDPRRDGAASSTPSAPASATTSSRTPMSRT